MKNNISVPKPCNENWENMSLDSNGRFCNSCEQIVVDFTTMTDQEILNFLSKSQQKVCGRFKTEQVQKKNNALHSYLSEIYSSAYLKIKNKALKYSALLVVGGLMIITGCNPKKPKTTTTTGEPLIDRTNKDSICHTQTNGDSNKRMQEHTIGEVAPRDWQSEDNSTKTTEPDKTHTIGKIAMPDSSSKIVTPYPNKKIKKKIKDGDL
jgi:hypothetical protein